MTRRPRSGAGEVKARACGDAGQGSAAPIGPHPRCNPCGLGKPARSTAEDAERAEKHHRASSTKSSYRISSKAQEGVERSMPPRTMARRGSTKWASILDWQRHLLQEASAARQLMRQHDRRQTWLTPCFTSSDRMSSTASASCATQDFRNADTADF